MASEWSRLQRAKSLTTAMELLIAGRPVQWVKKTMGLTYQIMAAVGMIKRPEIRDKRTGKLLGYGPWTSAMEVDLRTAMNTQSGS